jgi:hypothetical protein
MSVIPQTPRASRGLSPPPPPLGPLTGLCPGPAVDLKRSLDPSPNHTHPLTTNHGTAPDVYVFKPFKTRNDLPVVTLATDIFN